MRALYFCDLLNPIISADFVTFAGRFSASSRGKAVAEPALKSLDQTFPEEFHNAVMQIVPRNNNQVVYVNKFVSKAEKGRDKIWKECRRLSSETLDNIAKSVPTDLRSILALMAITAADYFTIKFEPIKSVK